MRWRFKDLLPVLGTGSHRGVDIGRGSPHRRHILGDEPREVVAGRQHKERAVRLAHALERVGGIARPENQVAAANSVRIAANPEFKFPIENHPQFVFQRMDMQRRAPTRLGFNVVDRELAARFFRA